jgi:ABC-type siderophore export system fused ATPase/permease subunit
VMQDFTSLQKDITKISTIVDRFDVAIDKLTEVSTSVSQLLAVHETKITAHDVLTKQTVELMEKRRVETDDKIQILHERISSGERELKTNIDKQYDELMTEIKEMRAESTKQHTILSDRITAMEKWMWIVIGGAIVVGVILAQVDFQAIFG